MDQIPDQLRRFRRQQGVTLKELARRSGVHWVTLSRFENGLADLGVRKLVRVGQALGLSLTFRPAAQGYTLDDIAGGFLQERTEPKSRDKVKSVLKRSRGLK